MSETEYLRIMISACCGSHQCEKAIAAMEQLLGLNPSDAPIHFQAGLCYSGACRWHSLTNPDFAIEHFRSALREAGPAAPPLTRAKILDALGNTYTYSRVIPLEVRIPAAIECAQQAADLYLTAGRFDDWARSENNVGLSICELAEKGSPDKWRDAIDHFENALCVRRRERDPEHYAATLQNFGTACRARADGDKASNIRRAVDCYRRALRIYRTPTFALKNAGLHNNLGNAFLSLPAASRTARNRNVRRALRHFERALRIRTRAGCPGDYAETQFNRGQAFLELQDGNEPANWRLATTCFREAAIGFHKSGKDANSILARRRLDLVLSYLTEGRIAREPPDEHPTGD